jgi:putative nucleotidyltransferase with HDIG domain
LGSSQHADVGDRSGGETDSNGDPVLYHLNQAEAEYRQFLAKWEQHVTALHDAEAKLDGEEQANRKLKRSLEESKAQAEQQRKRAERYKERANQLAASLKDIHRALFNGNIYNLILKACLTITGATRGLYITARGNGEALRIRAAVDIDGYPQAPPSEFIQALCKKVLEERDTLVCNDQQDLADLPKPSKPGENFHNCMVAPVVLLKHLDGIIIAADKMNGDFDEEDAETLLSVGDQASVAVENAQLQRELQNAYIATVSMLADAVEAKDPYTHGHCEMVSRYARLTAQRLNLTDYDLSIVCYGALLHDVGKIGVSDGVLNKPGPLLPEERDLVRSHVRVGHDLISKIPALETVGDVVLHHHEWYDGSGYPDGLKGDDIPVASRIVCVVDSYSAMITKRSYKEAYTDERARDELRRCAGTQFDPKVVDAFIAILDSPDLLTWDDEDDENCDMLPGLGYLKEFGQGLYA